MPWTVCRQITVELFMAVVLTLSRSDKTTFDKNEAATPTPCMVKRKKNYYKTQRNTESKYGYREETWNEEIAKNEDHFRKLMKSS